MSRRESRRDIGGGHGVSHGEVTVADTDTDTDNNPLSTRAYSNKGPVDNSRWLREVWKAYAHLCQPTGAVTNIGAWRETVATDARRRFARTAAAMLENHPGLSPELAAKALKWPGLDLEAVVNSERLTAAARAAERRAMGRLVADRELDRFAGWREALASARARLDPGC